MRKTIRQACTSIGAFFSERTIQQKTLSKACIVILVGMLIPLFLIALFNYPADDDFKAALPGATVLAQSGSIVEVAKTIFQQTYECYMTWTGNFVSNTLVPLSPMLVNINLYFLSNWFVLALLCLSIGYLLKALLHTLGATPKSVFWIAYTAVMVLVLQFMPSIGDSIYWHTGGMYTVVSCTLMLTLGMLVHCAAPQSRARGIWRGVMLALCGFMLGGSFYGPALGALVLLVLLTLRGFLQKNSNRFYCLLTLGFYCISFGISVMAPGIALRQEFFGQPMNPLSAVLVSVLDSFDLVGGWLSPQLFAMAMLLIPILWKPLKESRLQFRHPFWFMVMLYGLFSATLVPGVYTGSSYGMGRYMNTIYFHFLIMALGSLAYAEGWCIRFLQRRKESQAAHQTLSLCANLGNRFTALYLAICISFLILGGFAFTIMNTSSVCATKSLITGEAAQFRRDMEERQEYIRVTDSDVVQVKPLASQPFVFKPDKLPFQGIYGRVRYMKWYFELFYNE